jgi:hypothetical protein
LPTKLIAITDLIIYSLMFVFIRVSAGQADKSSNYKPFLGQQPSSWKDAAVKSSVPVVDGV